VVLAVLSLTTNCKPADPPKCGAAGLRSRDLGLRTRLAKLSDGVSLDYPGILLLGIGTSVDLVKPR
jgi:hypothetical protein